MKSEREIDALKRHARERVKEAFKNNGLATYRKVGLQSALVDEIVLAAIKGDVEAVYRKKEVKK